MKTLDEVIETLTRCTSPYIDCDDCIYTAINEDNVVFCDYDQLNKDALEHLKKYQRLLYAEESAETVINTAAAPWDPERNRYCCDHCGEYVGKHDKFCPGCGRMLTDWTEVGRKAK